MVSIKLWNRKTNLKPFFVHLRRVCIQSKTGVFKLSLKGLIFMISTFLNELLINEIDCLNE